MQIINQIKKDMKPIAADVATIGGSIGALIALIVNVSPSIHIPAGTVALLVGVSTVVTTVVAEARRFAGAKKAVVPTPAPAPAPTPAPAKKAVVKKTSAPAKKTSTKKTTK